jgi:hypothetical protein
MNLPPFASIVNPSVYTRDLPPMMPISGSCSRRSGSGGRVAPDGNELFNSRGGIASCFGGVERFKSDFLLKSSGRELKK